MRARALVSAITFSLLLVLLLVVMRGEAIVDGMVVHAGQIPETGLGATSLETWDSFQPGGWVGSTPVTCSVEVYNPGGFVDEAVYQYKTGGAWTSWTGANIQLIPLDATRRRVVVSSLPFPQSATADQNQIQFRYKSAGGGWLESGAYSVLVDTTAPNSTIAVSSCYHSAIQIVGTATDSGSGVALVQIQLQRSADAFYYNGSSWQQAPSWIVAEGTTTWSLSLASSVDSVYTTTVRAMDYAGLLQDPSTTATFRYDVTPPQSAVTSVGYFKSTNWPGAISGTAEDMGLAIASVQITLQRSLDGFYYNGSSWGPTATWLPAAGTTAWSLPFFPVAEGAYTVTSVATDACGNVETVPGVGTFMYDNSPTESTILTTGCFNTWPGAITGTASDPLSGIAAVRITVRRATDGFYYSGSAWGPTSVWITASGTTAWSAAFVPPVETVYTVTSQAIDQSGNVQTVPSTGSFIWDITAPAAPVSLATQPVWWTPLNSFTITWANPSDLSGVDTVHYKWDTAPVGNADESQGSPFVGDGIQSMPAIAVPVEGAHQLFLWLEDKCGNVNFQNRNATGAGVFKWDITPPATTVAATDARQGCSGWLISAAEVTLQAADVNPNPTQINATSGVSATFWRKDGNAWQQVVGSSFEIADQGAHVVEYYSVDVAGNAEPSRTISPTIKIDTAPPTTSQPSFTGTLGPNDWYRSGVSVTLAAMDATSGISATYHQVNTGTLETGSPFYINTDGIYSIRYYSVDAACNQERTYTATLKIDKTYPSTTHRLEGRLGDNGWFLASPVTVTLSATDVVTGVQASSGVDQLRYRIDGGSWQVVQNTGLFTIALSSGQKEGARFVEYYATDLAGNTEPVHTLTVGIDFQAPPALPIAPYSVPSGWTSVNCFDVKWFQNPVDFSGIGGAYYSFQAPISDTDGTLFVGDGLTSIPCVQVPGALGDGLRSVYVWLRDKAGNKDYRTRNSVVVALDRTPPQVTPVVSGEQCGTAGWYNSPITITFVATDTLSGMASGVISYQVNGEGWIQGTSYTESRDGRYVVECRATDVAGNTSDVITGLVRLDRVAPETPTPVWVEPGEWSKDSVFTVRWVNPGDLSGLVGVYYKQGSPPTGPTDGTYVDGVHTSLAVVAATEGAVPVYVWLVDRACNSDHQKAAMATLQHDSTPPTTTFSSAGTLGGNGWYITPVSITLSCLDSYSGCGPNSDRYRIGNGAWQNGNSFLIEADGTVPFSYYSVDSAGNPGSPVTATVKIDRTPPSSYAYSDGYSPSPSFTVHWEGSDPVSGIDTFDVQYKIGTAGQWQNLVLAVDPAQKSKLFTGVSGKVFYFRTRARDKAGNVEPYPAVADTYVSVDSLANGDFEKNLGSEWATTGVCAVRQIYAPSYTGGSTRVAVLGCPDQETGAPFGESIICQTISVPSAQDMPAPRLQFRYRVFTYDVLWGEFTQKFYDSFHAGVSDPGQMSPTYVFTDGNRTQNVGVQMDLGWREGSVDLRPYAGQTIRACLANVTREDTDYNTWTLVDDVRMVNLEYKITLPVVQRMRIAQVSAAEEESGAVQPNRKGQR